MLGESFLSAFIGLAAGITVGSGMVAFLVVLDIIPRLAQITRTFSRIHAYEAAVVLGSLVFTWVDFSDVHMHVFPLGAAIVGLFAGCFVGLLAAALTEIVNVLPILAKRVGMDSYLIVFLMAMIFGKVFGSLFEWLFY
ncbi:stage V sporulation protein AB [Paenibacillus roseipurpureus]|uniref:Stage V sporulation protein AB n=1 Tax=Paenibacillus roseopurpureus TaxID=2918901 RepID=A0AA96LTK0_9BACL|nr:stage V sporulation protein AB [Paenibacillus sp. MBLB1832]WNR47078.1 stage V sporulation protein AB [Paenibacillus sp. MBLB1832]